MALTAEQQAQVDLENALQQGRVTEQLRIDGMRTKLDAVRMAKDTLVHNRLDQPSGSREITATDITTFADTLVTYINS
jgi:hypothetical protein